jgi:RNA polymerase sigma-70 factor (ECF subfamily)
MTQQHTITQLLNRAAAAANDDGSRGAAANELLAIVYDELRSLASGFFRNQKPGNTLQPTALVHEAYLKLVDQSIEWQSRNQFFVVAAKAMRSILVDHARGKGTLKRGGRTAAKRVSLTDSTPHPPGADAGLDDATLLAIDEAMSRLARLDGRKARLVELRFFAGLTSEQAADALGIARSTAAEEWRIARAWLYNELADGGAGS